MPRDLDLDQPAAAVLRMHVELEPGGVLRRTGRYAVALAMAAVEYLAAPGDERPGPSVPGHLVVTHVDGTVLLRIPSHAQDEHLLAHVRRQLDELTVGAFLDRWSATPVAG